MRTGTGSIGYVAPLAALFFNIHILQITTALRRLTALQGSGCADGTTEGLQGDRHAGLAACGGEWRGHVATADHLCAPGWRVCGAQDYQVLQTITWNDATGVSGCFAFDAAQDGGQCRPCIADIEQDDLAGVGSGCPHQTYGQRSCISGGQIEVSCCIDAYLNRSCTYRPGISSGVICCRLPGSLPQILVEPESQTQLTTGSTFVLSCQAIGSPVPMVTWYKDGLLLPGNEPRIAVFNSGYMVVSESRQSDNGLFQCVASNLLGNATANATVIVSDYASGCADGTSDGLHQYEDIQACAGSWFGHVKRGRRLCARGWKVCSSRDTSLLTLLTWADVTELDGCYGYNAENSLNQCGRCHRRDTMAGVGAACGRVHRKHSSCLAQGRIDVYRPPDSDRATGGCDYREGQVSGVLCCRSRHRKTHLDLPKCSPRCDNGGTCISYNKCVCKRGYKGAWCQNAMCPGGCMENATCVRPGVCRCKPGHSGDKCKRRRAQCLFPCMHGGRCKQGKCKCVWSHYGEYCQHTLKWHNQAEENRTER